MQYLKTEAARIIVRRLRLIAEFVPGVGARCPMCGEWNRAETGAIRLKSGKKNRYHACISCGYKYKSEDSDC